ncbi:PGAP1-like protein-domain-containing protein [Lipomyces oligophaga]|uniref:PGAP1-like protein-domain-containing protein n=1 Tax=Lipomyces oligophaga TaxID=45792 RepID=UPI0034CF9EFC
MSTSPSAPLSSSSSPRPQTPTSTLTTSASTISSGSSPRRPRFAARYFRRRSSILISPPTRTYYRTLSIVVVGTLLLTLMLYSSIWLQTEFDHCQQPSFSQSYAKIKSFTAEHSRLASKYSLYLYREQSIDLSVEPTGVPVLFIPGNAGSYKQVRELAAEAAHLFYESIEPFKSDDQSYSSLDFFTADFNEDFTAFHGRTLLDQAEYLNDAISFILSLYSSAYQVSNNSGKFSLRPPSSVILIGHSMGGFVARTMFTLPNYRAESVNTIITLSTPHSVPPTTFDWDLVDIYQRVNRFWRESYSDLMIGKNPLSSVSLISIAGGSGDTIVPSDYTNIASLVPPTNGFTVFSYTIPNVWTGVDHLAVAWCHQLRHAIVDALLQIVDCREPSRTKSLSARMEIFRSQFLTGLETLAPKSVPFALGHDTLLQIPDNLDIYTKKQRRIVIRDFGKPDVSKLYMTPVPTESNRDFILSILTSHELSCEGDQELTILLCEEHDEKLDTDALKKRFGTVIDKSTGGRKKSYACSNLATDRALLPAIAPTSEVPFSYIQYNIADLHGYKYVAIIDSYKEQVSGFVSIEIFLSKDYLYTLSPGIISSLIGGSRLKLPATRTGFSEISLPGLTNSIMSYNLHLSNSKCSSHEALFNPLLRQFLTEPYESKFFPDAQDVKIWFHGSSPFVPLITGPGNRGPPSLKLQLWQDPTCSNPIEMKISVDVLGTLGNLVIRYRTAISALPLAVAAMVIFAQFNSYDNSGTFITFGAALDVFIGKGLFLVCLASSLFVVCISYLIPQSTLQFAAVGDKSSTTDDTEYRMVQNNDIFLGISDPYLFFVPPILFVISTAMCIVVYYVVISFLLFIATTLDRLSYVHVQASSGTPTSGIPRDRTKSNRILIQVYSIGSLTLRYILFGVRSFISTLAFISGGSRFLTIFTLLLIVSAYVPFQFAYLVVLIVHVNTCIKSLRVLSPQYVPVERFGPIFSNFSISILMLMIWVLPINIPVLIVWIHNLSVKWTTPFSSHHNLLSITPIIFLVENMTSGKMIPRSSSKKSQMLTKGILLYLAVYACLNGVLNAFWLHHVFNVFALWLSTLYLQLLGRHNRSNISTGSMFKNIFDVGLARSNYRR